MDGLLLDTERPMIALWVKVGQNMGYNVTPELIIRTLGIDGPGTRAIIMGELGKDFPYDKVREEVHNLAGIEEKNGIALRPGVIAMLDHLSLKKIPAIVATSTRRETAFRKLAQAGIRDRFTLLVGGDEITNGKPAPDIFLKAAERLGKDPSQCVGFEDSPAGLQALHAAGIRSVFVKDMAIPTGEVLATVWRQYSSLAEAVELFE